MRRAARLFGVVLALAATPAYAALPARYGVSGGPTARGGVEARIEELVVDEARRAHRDPVRPDARLEAAAAELARRTPPDGRPPNELVQAALWLHGIVEPPPHLLVVGLTPGQESTLFEQLRARLPHALAEGRFRRVGVAAQPRGNQVLVVLALQESSLELAPVPRALPAGGQAPLVGKLLPPLARPEAFVTAPDGKVSGLALGGDAHRFRATFRCGRERGRYQVELNGDDRFGAAVAANFPIYCGVPAPAGLPASLTAHPDAAGDFRDPRRAERELDRLVNADRAKAGLAPLTVDERLAAVARAHSADMLAHGFVGHISPSTGSAADRLRRAHIDAARILENVARAYSPGEAERGLMASPGHRANVLDREATHLGIGVAVGPPEKDGGATALLVTQLFIRPPDPVGAHSQPELRRGLDRLRESHHLPPLGKDPELDRLATKTARDLASGALAPAHAGDPIDRALGTLANRYRTVRSVMAVAGDLAQLEEGMKKAVLEAGATTLGVGIAAGRRADGSGALFAIAVLATRR
ncbi:MAG TPA: CAP domain-containing protein [Polyangia bacterium]